VLGPLEDTASFGVPATTVAALGGGGRRFDVIGKAPLLEVVAMSVDFFFVDGGGFQREGRSV
jgi:hypothetical protein